MHLKFGIIVRIWQKKSGPILGQIESLNGEVKIQGDSAKVSIVDMLINLINYFANSVQGLIYTLIASTIFLDYLHSKLEIIPRELTWLPELLVVWTSIVALFHFAFVKKKYLRPMYLVLIFLYVISAFLGALLNNLSIGEIIVGVRRFFTFIPLFILPFYYEFSAEQFRRILNFVLFLMIIQVPIALWQRFIQFRGVLTGDVVTGTLDVSSALSLCMVSSISILFGLYIKKKISRKLFILYSVLLFIPTTINETKSTLLFIPIVFITPVIVLIKNEGAKQLKRLISVFLIITISLCIFIPIYDYLIRDRWGYGILTFLTMENRLEDYLYQGSEGESGDYIARGDILSLSYKNLKKDVGNLFFGLGIGAVSKSYLSVLKNSEHEASKYGATELGFSNIFWELGINGLFFYLTLQIMIIKDCLYLSQYDNIFGDFAIGWISVLTILFIGLFYKNTILFSFINMMSWLFSGILVSKCYVFKYGSSD